MKIEGKEYRTFAIFDCNEWGQPIRESIQLVTIADEASDFEKAELLLRAYKNMEANRKKEKP